MLVSLSPDFVTKEILAIEKKYGHMKVQVLEKKKKIWTHEGLGIQKSWTHEGPRKKRKKKEEKKFTKGERSYKMSFHPPLPSTISIHVHILI